jgi:hypothetical protein
MDTNTQVCLDHRLVHNEQHPRAILRAFVRNYDSISDGG